MRIMIDYSPLTAYTTMRSYQNNGTQILIARLHFWRVGFDRPNSYGFLGVPRYVT
jgi:hypothetical protein